MFIFTLDNDIAVIRMGQIMDDIVLVCLSATEHGECRASFYGAALFFLINRDDAFLLPCLNTPTMATPVPNDVALRPYSLFLLVFRAHIAIQHLDYAG